MSPIPFQWKKCSGLVAYPAPILCIVAVIILLGRGIPVGLLHGTHRQGAHSLANQSHRPCFDHNDSQWLSCPPVTLCAPAAVAEPNQLVADLPKVEIIANGWHCDRPPPTR
jgi:hypothetical protein